jgi:hypothetical protein
MLTLTKVGHILGSGTPNYLGGAYDITLHTVGSTKYALTTGFTDNSFSIFNVTNPITPTLVSSMQGTGSPNYLDSAAKIKVYNISGTNYCFITSYLDNSLVIIDIDDPNNPVTVGHISGIGAPNYLNGAYGLAINTISGTNYCFVTSIKMID